jgi:hypothetical protein
MPDLAHHVEEAERKRALATPVTSSLWLALSPVQAVSLAGRR